MSWRESACQWGTMCWFSYRCFVRPTTITIRRWGAVRSVSGRTTPPYSIRVAQKSKMTKLNASRWECFFMQQVRTTPPYSIRVALNFRYFAKKKSEKNMSTTNAKIELWFEPELNFCTFWGLENEPPKALWTPTWLHQVLISLTNFHYFSPFFQIFKVCARAGTDTERNERKNLHHHV